MRTQVLAVTLVLTLAGSAAGAAEPESKSAPTTESEPVKCYRLLGTVDSGMSVGLAVELCAATLSAIRTIECFGQAFAHAGDGGLGLNRGLAVDLCRTIPRDGS
jgi:hypothetical protein